MYSIRAQGKKARAHTNTHGTSAETTKQSKNLPKKGSEK